MDHHLKRECVWFDQRNYELAEAACQINLVNGHLGLKVEVKPGLGPLHENKNVENK